MGNEEYHCKLCYNATGTYKCHNCPKCISHRMEWERERREREERERIRREREERERRERREREEREKRELGG